MVGLAIPKKLEVNTKNRGICLRIGIMFNGKLRPDDVEAYDIDKGWIRLRNAEHTVLTGKVEPFWK